MNEYYQAEVLEPEVLPPITGGARTAEATGPEGLNPIIAGLMIDILNLFTFGIVGFIAGGAIGYWAANSNRVPLPLSLVIAIATGWYCALPLPRTIPLATLIGLILVMWRKWSK